MISLEKVNPERRDFRGLRMGTREARGFDNRLCQAAQKIFGSESPLPKSARIRTLRADGREWTLARVSFVIALGDRDPPRRGNLAIFGAGLKHERISDCLIA
jgi:hypothetical protein